MRTASRNAQPPKRPNHLSLLMYHQCMRVGLRTQAAIVLVTTLLMMTRADHLDAAAHPPPRPMMAYPMMAYTPRRI